MNCWWNSKKYKKAVGRQKQEARKRLVALAGGQIKLSGLQRHYAAEDAIYDDVRCPRSFRWYLTGNYWEKL